MLVVVASAAIGQTIFMRKTRSLLERSSKSTPLHSLPANLIKVPLTRQSLDFTCGPAALASLMFYYDRSMDFLENALAKELKSNDVDGTLVKEMVLFSESQGFKVTTHYNWTLDALKASIDKGVPVMVLLQAWADLEAPGHDYKTDWEDGHFSIAVGYDQDNIYFMDPSTFGHYTFISLKEFLERWHDVDGAEKVFNFGMTITKGDPWYEGDLILKME